MGVAALIVGLWSEWVAFGWEQPLLWVPDLLTGWVLIGAGLVGMSHRDAPAPGYLLLATGFTWFAGVWPASLYWHRGPLVQLIVTYAGWRPRSRLDVVAVSAGYAAALVPALWASDAVTAGLLATLLVVAWLGLHQARPRQRSQRRTALQAALLLALALVGGVVARATIPRHHAVVPSLLLYQVALAGIAILLVARLPRPSVRDVADLVVELDARDSGTLRSRLAAALGDPSLELGFWSPTTGAYADDEGQILTEHPAGSDRRATVVNRRGARFALLVHDPQTLADPALLEVVASATQLADTEVTLRRAVADQVQEVVASRRRLLAASDAERTRLADRLAQGPQQRLAVVASDLARLDPAGEALLEEAREHLSLLWQELADLSSGLRPKDLEPHGLSGGLAAVASRCPVPVTVSADVPRLPGDVELAGYFVAAEALANVAKHACASQVSLNAWVETGWLVLTVSDDGVGGANPAGGSGIAGLVDRVEALAGTLRVDSSAGSGTRVIARLPIS